MTNLIRPQTASNPGAAPIHRTLLQTSHRDQPNPTKKGQAIFNQGELRPADV